MDNILAPLLKQSKRFHPGLVAPNYRASCAVAAQVQVDGHFRRDGTYVQPHVRSAPDNQRYNNYNAQGSVNPYSGERGTQRHEFSNPPVQQIQPYQNPYPQQRRGY